MVEHIITYLESIVESFGPTGLFLAAFIEEVIAPIPSAVVMMAGGFFFLGGLPVTSDVLSKLTLEVALPIALGFTLGSTFIYAFFYFLGKPAVERYGSFFRLTWKDIERLNNKLKKGWIDEAFLFLFRALPIMPGSVVNVFCGVIRWNFYSFVLISFVGIFFRALILGFFGWQLGAAYKANASILDMFSSSITLGVLILFIVWLVWRRRKTLMKERGVVE